MTSKAIFVVVWGFLGCLTACSRQSAPGPQQAATGAGIVFRAAASAGATAKVLTLTINKPAGTMAGNVMLSSIGVRPNTVVITAPAGWTLVRRSDTDMHSLKGGQVNPNSLAVYSHVAGESEPASYSWTFDTSVGGSVGGVVSFAGVDTGNPIDVELAQNTGYNISHDAPSVTTTVPNTMLVTSHAYRTSASWTPPMGMTEAVDVRSELSAAGLSLEMNYALQSAVGPTGIRTATALGIEDDTGNTHTFALRPGSSAP